MFRRVFALIAGGVIALGIAGAAEAHPGHASCAGGAPGAHEANVIPIGPGPDFGTEFARLVGMSGNARAALAQFHADYCDSH